MVKYARDQGKEVHVAFREGDLVANHGGRLPKVAREFLHQQGLSDDHIHILPI